MALWKYAAALAAIALPVSAPAQDSFPVIDNTHAMGVYGAEAAVMDAARGGRGSRQVSRPRTRSGSAASASNARARRQCANARDQAGDGMRDPRLSRILSLCNRGGY
jgi:hypothetical protein